MYKVRLKFTLELFLKQSLSRVKHVQAETFIQSCKTFYTRNLDSNKV